MSSLSSLQSVHKRKRERERERHRESGGSGKALGLLQPFTQELVSHPCNRFYFHVIVPGMGTAVGIFNRKDLTGCNP